MSETITFTNAVLCQNGVAIPKSHLTFCTSTGTIVDPVDDSDGGETVDLDGKYLAPGFLELQTNGMRGFHFTHFDDDPSYRAKIDEVARYLPTQGVTGFWATIPTVSSVEFKKILPSLKPRNVTNGASLLGAHAEGPYLFEGKKGAHNASLFHQPSTPPTEIYGAVADSNSVIKLVTLAPELPGSTTLISNLVLKSIRVSIGHSSASYSDGLAALEAGASCLTHTLNAMAPLHHRYPGLAGLVTAAPSTTHSSPYYSIIPDGNHLHPSVATMLFRSNPSKCILITDSIELAGLEDGTYAGHSQIPCKQTKKGSRVVIEGTETLIGGCASLAECMRNLCSWSGCTVPEAVRCVTENVADFMGEKTRGKLEVGRRADFAVLDSEANVVETWIGGKKV